MSRTAETLRELRKDAGLTLAQVAERAGISVSYLSDVERGRRANPDAMLATLNKIAAVYGKRVVVEVALAAYDPSFGDDRLCECGHAYYRHFDTYEHMEPVGCKYCECYQFRAALAALEEGEGHNEQIP
jgi:transcriptional regulator with XRE-family HTH domain